MGGYAIFGGGNGLLVFFVGLGLDGWAGWAGRVIVVDRELVVVRNVHLISLCKFPKGHKF